jgi:TolB-like protein/DNA-binding SARP family transcriptional activator
MSPVTVDAGPCEEGSGNPPLTRICLLGRFAAWRADGAPAPRLGRRGVALLACLALSEAPWVRDDLAALLWPGRSRDQSRASLRQELLHIRRAFGWAPNGNAGSGLLSLPLDLAEVDVVRFRQALADPATLADAVGLYRGPLLQGIRVEPQEPFTAWLADHRARLHADALRTMLQLLGSGTGCEALARRILAVEPACEPAHQFLMRHYAQRGDPTQVLVQFRACSEALRAAGGGAPSADTRSLLDEITAVQVRSAAPAPTAAVDWIRHAPDRTPIPAVPAAKPLPLIEDRPSVAVLPFQDLSHDPLAAGVLADGMTEEVTNALARLPGFFVTARQSAFAYRGLGMDVRRIAAELGVRYLVEGSVEQDGRRMRANVRLMDGRTGLHLWADAQGGPMRDVMAVRDAIVHRLAGRLHPRLVLAEVERAVRSPPEELDAWTWLQRANGMLLRGRNRLSVEQVLEPLRRALAVDPNYAMAHALLSAVYTWRALSMFSADPEAERRLARQHAEAALRAEPENPFVLVHCAEAEIYSAADIDAGLALLEAATERDPNDANGLALLGHARRFAGQDPRASLALIDGAIRLSPRDPRTFNWHLYANWCHWQLGDLASMEAASRRSIELYGQNTMSWIGLTGAFALQGRLEEGREAATVLRRQRPGFTPDGYYQVLRHYYGRRFRGQVERDCDLLRVALNRVW